MRFRYHTEPIRTALIMVAVVVIAAFLIPNSLLRIIVLALAAGPGAWAILQRLRRRVGVHLTDDRLVIENALNGRTSTIPYTMIRGYLVTPSGGLVVAYTEPPKPEAAKPAIQGVALTAARPESHRRPKQRLVVAPPIDDADNLIRALDMQWQRVPPTVPPVTEQELRQWMRRKQIRDWIVLIVGVLATPLYVIIIGRVIASFLNVLGVSNVR
ncbi:MAG: hypothetical protein IT324_20885 [Anaerolineae bacterium]|nr:hypothetical protein [Anaerolineae bacterium]